MTGYPNRLVLVTNLNEHGVEHTGAIGVQDMIFAGHIVNHEEGRGCVLHRMTLLGLLFVVRRHLHTFVHNLLDSFFVPSIHKELVAALALLGPVLAQILPCRVDVDRWTDHPHGIEDIAAV